MPSSGPSGVESEEPSNSPSQFLISVSSSEPSSHPTGNPVSHPTSSPTLPPTVGPSRHPTAGPTLPPTGAPSRHPTSGPTLPPTGAPSRHPTPGPTLPPTGAPSRRPTPVPTLPPTGAPSRHPTPGPTLPPTRHPTPQPTLQPTRLDLSQGFACASTSIYPFTSNSTVSGYPKLVPMTTGTSSQCVIRLTPENQIDMASSAMLSYTFANANKAFSVSFGYRIYRAGNSDGGEGMAFVIHQDPRGIKALGGAGGSLGFHGPQAINPGFIVELDTQPSGGKELMDQGGRNIHILVRKNQVLTEISETQNYMRTDTDGLATGRVWIHYCSTQTLRIYLNNTGTAKPAAPVTTTQVNLNDLFVGQSVYLGLTASTSSQKTDNQDMTTWQFSEDCNATF
ncbi:hypothetical protein ACA910_015712 [Epithemia clementina (nom. ined.)]